MRQRLSSAESHDIGARIRELRRERGLNQEEVAELSELSTSLIGHIERGEKSPSLGTVMVLCQVFHVSMDYLIWGRADVICDREHCPLYQDMAQIISKYQRTQ